MAERMQHGGMTTPCQHTRTWLLLIGWMWLWLPGAAAAADAPAGDAEPDTYFSVRKATADLRDDVYLLDADIDFRFSDAAMEALTNGIPLVLEIQIKVERRRGWLWDDNIAALSQRYSLQYHALSDRYVVHNLNTGQRQSYTTLDDALFVLGRVREFPMLDRRLLEAGNDYEASVRAALVVEQLPTPMRLWAYASDQWHLDSAWYSWRLRQ